MRKPGEKNRAEHAKVVNMARLAALYGLIGALLVGVDAYSTCTDHVHEWIRFHGESTTVMQSLLNW